MIASPETGTSSGSSQVGVQHLGILVPPAPADPSDTSAAGAAAAEDTAMVLDTALPAVGAPVTGSPRSTASAMAITASLRARGASVISVAGIMEGGTTAAAAAAASSSTARLVVVGKTPKAVVSDDEGSSSEEEDEGEGEGEGRTASAGEAEEGEEAGSDADTDDARGARSAGRVSCNYVYQFNQCLGGRLFAICHCTQAHKHVHHLHNKRFLNPV